MQSITPFITLGLTIIVGLLWMLVMIEAAKRGHWGWLIVMIVIPLAAVPYWLLTEKVQRPREDALPARRSESGEFPPD